MSSNLNLARVIICLKDKNNSNVARCGKVDVLADNTLKIQSPRLNSKVFGPFNKILDKDVNYQRVFYEAAKIHADEGFNGMKSFIISYGFSSSGKTDTLFGSNIKELGGVLKETLDYIEKKRCQDVGSNVDFYFSVFEICGDKIFELLSDDKKEISIVSDDDNKLIVKEPIVLPILNVKTVCNTIRDALNRKSLASNTDFQIVPRSHVLVKLKIVTKNKSGVINYGEMVFVDLSSTNLMIGPHDKQINSEIKATKIGYISLNLLLGKILKNPQPSQSFRESTLTRILRPALSGSYTSSMIFTVTTDHVPGDAFQSLEIADKYRKLRCCPQKESLVSLEVRRNIKNIRIPLCDAKEIESIELIPTDTEARRTIQSLHQEIEENKKHLEEYIDILSKREIDFEETSKICSEKGLQHDFFSNEKQMIVNQLAKINEENSELKLNVDQLKTEITHLLDKFGTLQETSNKYCGKLENVKSKGSTLLNKDLSLDKTHVEINNTLIGIIKDLEKNYLEVKNFSKNLINNQRVFVNELKDQYFQNNDNFQKIENSLQSYSNQLDNFFSDFTKSIKERQSPETTNELYGKVSKSFDELLVTLEKTKNACAIRENECLICIEKIIKDESEKVTKFFIDYKKPLLQEVCEIEEIISVNNKYNMQIELVQKNIDDVKKILEEVKSIQIPTIDIASLNLPSKEKYIVNKSVDIDSLFKFNKTEKPHLIKEMSFITNKIFGSDYFNLVQGEENKENF